MRSPSILATWHLVAMFGALSLPLLAPACGTERLSNVKTFEVQKDVYVQISASATEPGKVDIVLQSSKFSGLALCEGAGECSPGSQNYHLAAEQAQKDGYRIFGFQNSFKPDESGIFVVVETTSGQVARKFRLRPAGVVGNPLETGLAQINRQVMEQELHHLASDQFNGRLSATKDHESAADFIIANLEKLNIPPLQPGNYRQAFKMTVGPTSGQTTHNVLALLEGNDPVLKNEYVVIGAHLDHAGTMQRGYTCSFGAGNDPICNGADDNGSGSITVLSQAKALAAVRGSLKRSVILMWFSGEEEGLLGSAHYVRNPVVPLAKTVYMINVDMVGYLRTNNSTLLALGGGTSSAGKRIIQTAAARYPQIKVRISDSAGGGSDHVNFMGRGIPGVFFHTGVSNNPNYHKTSDSPDKIDYEGMFVTNKIIFETLLEVAGAASTKDSNSGLSLAGELGDGFSGGDNRPPLVTPEEMAQTCHHLMQNPYTR